MHPIQLIFGFIFNIFTLAFIALEVFLIREWYNHKDLIGDDRYAGWCLAAAIAAFVFISMGKLFWGFVLGTNGHDEPNMKRSKETSLISKADGQKIFLEFYGPNEAQVIIFVHGWSSDSTQWYYFKKHLSSQYRLILMDLPGCGKSGKSNNGVYSPESFARDLEVVVGLTGDKKPILVGHSIGGMTILSYCKLFSSVLQSKIAGIVLVQTTYTNPVKTSIMSGLLTAIYKPILTPMCHFMVATAPIIQIMNWVKFLNGSMHISNHLSGYAGTETRGQLALTSFLSAASPVAIVAKGMLGMFGYDATATLSKISVPALIVCGNKDILCKPEASQYMNKHIPNSQLVMLSPSGHMGPLERNEEMVNNVKDFASNVFSLSLSV